MTEVQNFKLVTVIDYGIGAVELIGQKDKEMGGNRAFIVTDPGLVQAGVVDQVIGYLEKEGLETDVFSHVKGNPPIESVDKGLEQFKAFGGDIMLAVGGGSAMDTAKAIGIVEANGGHILDYEFFLDGMKKEVSNRKKPLIAVPTTAGTGSEVTIWSVITDPKRNYKFSVGHLYMAPDLALVDPQLTVSVPASLTAATGMDALTHAIEGYVSKSASPQTDALAIKAIKLIADNLRQAYANGDNVKARDGMMMGSLMAGMSFGSASVGSVHAMAHTLGGLFDTPHGVANAILLPYVREYNLIGDPGKFADIAVAMGENISGLSLRAAAQRAVEAVKELSNDVEIPRLSEVGCKEEDIQDLAQQAAQDMNVLGNMRPTSAEAMVKIYKSAL